MKTNSLVVTIFQPHKCDFCSFICSEFERYLKHVKRHEGEPNFVLNCLYCPRKYTFTRYWRQHVVSHKEHNGTSTQDWSHQSIDTDALKKIGEPHFLQSDTPYSKILLN